MKLQIEIKINEKLFKNNPILTELGRNILKQSVIYIYNNGFESLTFKKIAKLIGSTEAGIYRFFENKHYLLVYLVSWYWGWLEYKVKYNTINIEDKKKKLEKVINILSVCVEDDEQFSFIKETYLHQIVINEGVKTYLTQNVTVENKDKFFKPYKDLCKLISEYIIEFNPSYEYPKSLASTIIEMSHFQVFFMKHLPSLTDFGDSRKEEDVINFLNNLTFRVLKNN